MNGNICISLKLNNLFCRMYVWLDIWCLLMIVGVFLLFCIRLNLLFVCCRWNGFRRMKVFCVMCLWCVDFMFSICCLNRLSWYVVWLVVYLILLLMCDRIYFCLGIWWWWNFYCYSYVYCLCCVDFCMDLLCLNLIVLLIIRLMVSICLNMIFLLFGMIVNWCWIGLVKMRMWFCWRRIVMCKVGGILLGKISFV